MVVHSPRPPVRRVESEPIVRHLDNGASAGSVVLGAGLDRQVALVRR